MLVLRPLSERVAEQVAADRENGMRSTYVRIYAGEDAGRSAWIAAHVLAGMGVYATVGTCVTRRGHCVEIIYDGEQR